jgi:hypothetical protein
MTSVPVRPPHRHASAEQAEQAEQAGRARGVFTADIDAVDLDAVIGFFCFFRVADRHSFGALCGWDLTDPERRAHYRTMLGDMIIRYLTGGAS